MSKVNDLTGQIFTKLTVIERAGSNKHGRAVWKCKCSCDNHTIVYVAGNDLTTGKVKSCGCLNTDNGLQRIEDLTNQIFGRLKVIEMCNHIPGEKVKWKCVCLNDGNVVEVLANNLKNGTTQSCGCLHKEVFHNIVTSHGLSNDPLYTVWCGMKSRCNNPNNSQYKAYGGRGIVVCDEWNNSFKKFYDDMSNEYRDGYQIDRIDNNKGYFKDNCRWVTPKENARNTRRNKYYETPFGKITIAELAEKLNAPNGLVRGMVGDGHSIEEIVTRFKNFDQSAYVHKKRTRHHTPYGEITLTEFAKELDVSRGFVARRYESGMTVEQIISEAEEMKNRRNNGNTDKKSEEK